MDKRKLRIILVGPEYEINLGHAARVLANFGFDELCIVRPKVKIGFNAKMFSKRAYPILQNAKIFKSLDEATKDCDFLVGTTGIVGRSKNVLRNPLTPRSFANKIKSIDGKTALLFGREGVGLTKKEIEKCDFLVTIPASNEYPVLNVSHAMAVVLYELFNLKKTKFIKRASREEKERLLETFNKFVDFFAERLRNPEKIKLSFKRIVGRSLISEVESRAILSIFERIKNKLRIREKKKQ